jgi:hypothetical protein
VKAKFIFNSPERDRLIPHSNHTTVSRSQPIVASSFRTAASNYTDWSTSNTIINIKSTSFPPTPTCFLSWRFYKGWRKRAKRWENREIKANTEGLPLHNLNVVHLIPPHILFLFFLFFMYFSQVRTSKSPNVCRRNP